MKPPKFWMNTPDRPSFWAHVLAPLAVLWKLAGRRRWEKGAHFKCSVPVICVGNVNLGGTGKTPSAIAIVMMLSDMQKNVHVITRGYKGSLQGPVLVDPSIHTADEVGDEPLLLAAFCKTWVAKDRQAGAGAAIDAGADVLVLDDGLQNPSLHKDLSILVVDTQVGFGNARVFPAGPLRETLSSAFGKADLVLAIGQRPQKFPDSMPVVTAQLEALPTGMDWDGLSVLAFAGIGRPEKFFDTLRGLGVDIKATRSFGDHQKIPNTLLMRLEKEAYDLNAQLVTTEKDAVRLPKAWQQKVLTLPVRLAFENNKLLLTKLRALFP